MLLQLAHESIAPHAAAAKDRFPCGVEQNSIQYAEAAAAVVAAMLLCLSVQA